MIYLLFLENNKYLYPEETGLEIWGDSQLIIKQLKGEYAVGKPHLKEIYEHSCELRDSIYHYYWPVKIEWNQREQNKQADSLADKAYEQYIL